MDPSNEDPQNNSKIKLKRTKVQMGLDPLNIIKKDDETQKKLAKEKKKRKLSSENTEKLFPDDDDEDEGTVDPVPTSQNPPEEKVIQTGNLNTLSDFINSDVPLAVTNNNTFDYNTKVKSIKGDFFTDEALIRRNCSLMTAETIKDLTKASYKEPDKNLVGVLVLTDFRIIFKFQDERNEKKCNFSEDYFKIPIFNIQKIEKVQDKRISYDAYPIEITLKDTRVIKFHVWDRINTKFYISLNDSIKPRDPYALFNFTHEYMTKLYNTENDFNGWNIYDPIKEYQRQGITEKNDLNLRYCYANKCFQLCATYPRVLIEHKEMTDDELKEASNYRTKNRLPVMSYYYKGNRDKDPNGLSKGVPCIWRSSQNKGGLIGTNRSNTDEKLLDCIMSLCAKLYIFDARPYINALANRLNGGGFENMKHYNNVVLTFCEIDNIHAARNSLNKVFQLCLSSKIMDNQKFWSSLESTNWYTFIYKILKFSNEISKTLQNNYSVLIHCSDGWDRSAQLISLSQVLVDPYFRTIEGLAVLIEKDWLSFGHQFGLRNGIYFKEPSEDQRSPIFLQWLDCLHQLLYQFPNAFEFNNELLLFLAKNYSTNLYGTFMFNSEKERSEKDAKNTTTSVWSDVMRHVSKYKNVYYNSENPVKILSPNYAPYNLHFWSDFFMEYNIYLENNKFYLSDIDKSIAFTNNIMFYEHHKRMDVLKYMNLELKSENLIKVLYDVYNKTKGKEKVLEKLSEKTRKYLEGIINKPEIIEFEKQKQLEEEERKKMEDKSAANNQANDQNSENPKEEAKEVDNSNTTKAVNNNGTTEKSIPPQTNTGE